MSHSAVLLIGWFSEAACSTVFERRDGTCGTLGGWSGDDGGGVLVSSCRRRALLVLLPPPSKLLLPPPSKLLLPASAAARPRRVFAVMVGDRARDKKTVHLAVPGHRRDAQRRETCA